MIHSLKEMVKSFSFQSMIRSNIMSSVPGTRGITSNSVTMSGAKKSVNSMDKNSGTLSSFYDLMKEIKDYERNELTQTIISIYKDYLIGYFNKVDELIELDDNVSDRVNLQSEINDYFKRLDVVSEIKMHLDDILYQGSFCFKVGHDKETRELIKYDLENPTTVVSVYRGRKQIAHLVTSKMGKIYEVKPESIFRIGLANLPLVNDMNKEYFGNDEKKDTLVKTESLFAGMPLYYNICPKIKEYLLKDLLLSLISIKDLIQPLILLLRLDKNTSIDQGNKSALNIETMLNKQTDLTMILSANFDINALMNTVSSNIKVFPDFNGGMGDMNDLDLSKLSTKIQEAEQIQDSKKEAILTYESIPRALYNGEATKWDAIKASQRLNSRIHGIKTNISESIRQEAHKYLREFKKLDIDLESIKVNLFTKTDVDYNVSLINLEIIGQLVDGIQRVLLGSQQTINDVRYINKEEYLNYIIAQLKIIDPELSKFFNEEDIKKIISEMQSAEGGG